MLLLPLPGLLDLPIEVGGESPHGQEECNSLLGLELLLVEDDSENFGHGEHDGDDDPRGQGGCAEDDPNRS